MGEMASIDGTRKELLGTTAGASHIGIGGKLIFN